MDILYRYLLHPNLILTFARYVLERLKQEGEDCGDCYCPPTYTAGTCAPGLKCKYDDTIPDLAGTCVRSGSIYLSILRAEKIMHSGLVKIAMLNIFVVFVDNSKNCVRECRDALNYWPCIMKCNEPKSRTAIGSDGKYKHF